MNTIDAGGPEVLFPLYISSSPRFNDVKNNMRRQSTIKAQRAEENDGSLGHRRRVGRSSSPNYFK